MLNNKPGPVFDTLPPGLKADKPIYWIARMLDRKHLQMKIDYWRYRQGITEQSPPENPKKLSCFLLNADS